MSPILSVLPPPQRPSSILTSTSTLTILQEDENQGSNHARRLVNKHRVSARHRPPFSLMGP